MKRRVFWTRAMKRRRARFFAHPFQAINRMHIESLKAERDGVLNAMRLLNWAEKPPKPVTGKYIVFPVTGGRSAGAG